MYYVCVLRYVFSGTKNGGLSKYQIGSYKYAEERFHKYINLANTDSTIDEVCWIEDTPSGCNLIASWTR